jgi:hypothetical protein
MTEMDRLPVPHLAALCQHLLQHESTQNWGFYQWPERYEKRSCYVLGGFAYEGHGMDPKFLGIAGPWETIGIIGPGPSRELGTS